MYLPLPITRRGILFIARLMIQRAFQRTLSFLGFEGFPPAFFSQMEDRSVGFFAYGLNAYDHERDDAVALSAIVRVHTLVRRRTQPPPVHQRHRFDRLPPIPSDILHTIRQLRRRRQSLEQRQSDRMNDVRFVLDVHLYPGKNRVVGS